jgi:hypothetical protein
MRRARTAVDVLTRGGFDFRGDLDVLVPREPEGLRHPDEVTHEEMLDSATRAMARLLRDVRDVSQERDGLQEQVRRLEHELVLAHESAALAAQSIPRKVARRVRARWARRGRTIDGGST